MRQSLRLLERDNYRYLQDSGAIKPVFEQRRFEVQRRITGPNNNPIYRVVYDAIDYLETLHAKLWEQQTQQTSSLEAIDSPETPATLDSIEVPTELPPHTTPIATKANGDPLLSAIIGERRNLDSAGPLARLLQGDLAVSSTYHRSIIR